MSLVVVGSLGKNAWGSQIKERARAGSLNEVASQVVVEGHGLLAELGSWLVLSLAQAEHLTRNGGD